MTAIAQELDRRLQSLDPKRAAQCEQLVREVLALVEDAPPATAPRKGYALPEHSFGLRADIDPTKLGQLADEL